MKILNKIWSVKQDSERISLEETVKQMVNLNPFPEKGYISEEVAERQFQVVLKGFQYLMHPDNQYLYIGDEVGLGKTYIALGIASLLRHFSDNPSQFTDLIIVPKKNLQYKWQKEIRGFIKNNYHQKDNRVKTVIKEPVGKINILNHLQSFSATEPQYVLMRNSSFSIASPFDNEEKNRWFDRLKKKLPEEDHELFTRIYKKFKSKEKDILVKRAFAYLLHKHIPQIDLLIVDEAHHYRHGIDKGGSIRNQLISRFLGAVKKDEELFEAFPELKKGLRPKVKKVIFLSATPIDRGLHEIRNQLDCVLPDHKYKKIHEDDLARVIENDLNQFMIRGIMKLDVNGKKYSRNQYRFEHRQGNVIEKEIADPQRITNPTVSMVLSLMQYLTIKELKQNNNNSFEMGMLAGFESFVPQHGEYEADTTESRRKTTAEDEHIIEKVIGSYYKKFGDYLPHPKQDSLVDEIFQRMLERKKSLIYVRRIASVRELERKLFKKYSDYLISIIKNSKNLKKITQVKKMLKAYEMDKDAEALEKCITNISEKIYPQIKTRLTEYYDKINNDEKHDLKEFLKDDIQFLFDFYPESDGHELSGIKAGLDNFRQSVEAHLYKKNIKEGLKKLTINLLLKKWEGAYDEHIEVPDDEATLDEDAVKEEKAPYFFQRFFFTQEGKNFKKRSYTKDWFEINPFVIYERYKIFNLKKEKQDIESLLKAEKTDFRKISVIKERFDILVDEKSSDNFSAPESLMKNTFLTSFLIESCEKSFTEWLEDKKGNKKQFIHSIETLNEILRSIFRQGSGLAPSFLAEALTRSGTKDDGQFTVEFTKLLENDFSFVKNEVLDILRDYDRIIEKNFDDHNRIRYNLIQQLPVAGVSGHHKKDVRKVAIQFRMPGYPYALITTDILKEGEDLHTYCKNIYHYGIAWNPSDMEQRTGRIDRIDSLAYNEIKQIPDGNTAIPFHKKLQVFYPYLIDTLEVNQMVKLFEGMENFIQIFYNDLAAGFKKDARAETDKLVISIPGQNSNPMESKYDFEKFDPVKKTEKASKKNRLGPSENDLINILKGIKGQLTDHDHDYEFKTEPYIDNDSFSMNGNMSISGRNGPFKVYFKPSKKAGSFDLVMTSLLGKVATYASNRIKDSLYERLEEEDLSILEINDYLWTLKKKMDCLNCSPEELVTSLWGLIKITDKFEDEFADGKDEEY